MDYSLEESVTKIEIPDLEVKDIVPPAGLDDLIYLTGAPYLEFFQVQSSNSL